MSNNSEAIKILREARDMFFMGSVSWSKMVAAISVIEDNGLLELSACKHQHVFTAPESGDIICEDCWMVKGKAWGMKTVTSDDRMRQITRKRLEIENNYIEEMIKNHKELTAFLEDES